MKVRPALLAAFASLFMCGPVMAAPPPLFLGTTTGTARDAGAAIAAENAAIAAQIATASVNSQNHLLLVTVAGHTIDAGPLPTSFAFTPALNLSFSRNSQYVTLF
jgi:hypothetical protein